MGLFLLVLPLDDVAPEEVAAESKLLPCRDDAAFAGLGSMERVVEQIAGAPVPQILEERVENRTPELTTEFPVPQFFQERVQNRTLEHIS